MLLIFYDFCQKFSSLTLANTPPHHFHYKSMKSQNVVFTKSVEKMQRLAKCWYKQKSKKLFKTVFVYYLWQLTKLITLIGLFSLKFHKNPKLFKILNIYEMSSEKL